jgi:Tol biopolymer transport system component
VPEQGGPIERVTTVSARGSDAHRYPQFLPDGNRFLYLYLAADASVSGVYLGSLAGAPPVRVLDGGDSAQFVPSSDGTHDGYVLFRRQDTLMAQRFDAHQARLDGAPIAVATDVGIGENTGLGAFSAAGDGTLIHMGIAGAQQEVVWLDRSGKRERVVASGVEVGDLALAPNERVVAMSVHRFVVEADIYLQGDAGSASRVTFGPAPGWIFPLWSPTGDQIAFASIDLAGRPTYEVRRKASNGAGDRARPVRTDLQSALFPIPSTGNVHRFIYQPSANGQRFVVSQPLAGSDPPITVVLNWPAALKT